MTTTEFLDAEGLPRPWQLPEGVSEEFTPDGFFLGEGDRPLEVAIAETNGRPNVTAVRRLWKKRHGRKPSPLLLLVLYGEGAGSGVAVCGPAGESPDVYFTEDRSQIGRVARAALTEPNRHAAVRFLEAQLGELDSELPGVRNVGMFAAQQLREGVPERDDWSEMCEKGQELLGHRGQQLVERLGFEVETDVTGLHLLRLKEEGTACSIAVFLDESERPDTASQRFDNQPPIFVALSRASQNRVPYVLVSRGDQLRVYSANEDVGVGQKGLAETFVEVDLTLLSEDSAGYLPLIFGANALRDGGSFETILKHSRDFASKLGARLRDRVYDDVVPHLAKVIAEKHHGEVDEVGEEELDKLYETAMVLLYRLLFVAYGEDRDLLPYRSNDQYQRHALKTHARHLAKRANEGTLTFDSGATDMWHDLLSLWEAVDQGNQDWGVPAYNGGLFSSDPEMNPVGERLDRLILTNDEIGPALFSLLVDHTEEGVYGPVDFRSLSVREFGTIYEGLLESSLTVAPFDLNRDADGTYVPAEEDGEVVIPEGTIYLQHSSGARKATGTYFTKHFAVNYLLDRSLGPALDEHIDELERLLAEGREADAADRFFDFRCADIAMGSGHFLVAAVDRIGTRLSTFLADNPIPGVQSELQSLRRSALRHLDDLSEEVEIETSSLLRRQVARRCVYGVDSNEIAVELARLALWIHTFVPGLPLSFLNHNLITGNSLTGIGTLQEAVDELEGEEGQDGGMSLWYHQIRGWLEEAKEALRKLGRTSEATATEVARAKDAHREALEAVEPARRFFDLLVGARAGELDPLMTVSDDTIENHPRFEEARQAAERLQAVHFPVAFPEVFLRDNPGFDCIVGNPPWEEKKVEELEFWMFHSPGLKYRDEDERQRRIESLKKDRPHLKEEYEQELEQTTELVNVLRAGPYPGMSEGDPDVYKAFAWRFWQLAADDAHIGVVLPRSIFGTKGSAPWRNEVLPNAHAEIALCKNKQEWLFTDVNPGYAITLAAFHRDAEDKPTIRIGGTYESRREFEQQEEWAKLGVGKLEQNDPLLCVPTFEAAEDFELFDHLIKHPPFGDEERPDWRARPNRELDVTRNKEYFDPEADHPVYNHRNVAHFAFDWSEGTYAHADWDEVVEHLQAKRERSANHSRSAFKEMSTEWIQDPSTLPCKNPRVVYRAIIHASNPRKVWAAVAPKETILTNAAPHLLFPRGGLREKAYVLGMLNSSVLDWLGHLKINLNLNYFILNSFPVPVMGDGERTDRFVELSAYLALQGDGDLGKWNELANADGGPDVREATAELDALASLLYELPSSHLNLIWPKGGTDARPSLESVQEHRSNWT